ncbi:MAG TPA: nitroreductase/quinone reductase family protein [Thermomicrobiales bacterium]|jgi:deazaflavin-dependent oxidoreductase (nitroreductase family)|nr:nitroreductase/quinone reductase family protein [Thermomicrobiales bacterium]
MSRVEEGKAPSLSALIRHSGDPRVEYEDKTVSKSAPDTAPALDQWANEPFAYLTTTGRRTGAPHRIEIWFAVDNGQLYLLSGGRDRSDWVQNLMANPDVSIELGTATFAGVAQALAPDTPEDRRARELLVQKYRKGNDLEEWGRMSLPVTITFASPIETNQEHRP